MVKREAMNGTHEYPVFMAVAKRSASIDAVTRSTSDGPRERS